jgi:hypothetical protein
MNTRTMRWLKLGLLAADRLADEGDGREDCSERRIDEIVPPGTGIGTLDQAYVPPAIQEAELRRRRSASARPPETGSCQGKITPPELAS